MDFLFKRAAFCIKNNECWIQNDAKEDAAAELSARISEISEVAETTPPKGGGGGGGGSAVGGSPETVEWSDIWDD